MTHTVKCCKRCGEILEEVFKDDQTGERVAGYQIGGRHDCEVSE